MINERKYVISSIELHLFFLRIMKEHAIFLEASFTPKNTKLAKEADYFKVEFEKVLFETLKSSSDIVHEDILDSEEIVTNYTQNAERKTEHYTGIIINERITSAELRLQYGGNKNIRSQTVRHIKQLNKRIYKLLDDFIEFKGRVLNEVLDGDIFTTNYPSLIKHIIHEANSYKVSLMDIESGNYMDYEDIKESEAFWNEIMMEHAETIRGLLDPSEKALFKVSNAFAENFNYLLEATKNITSQDIIAITNENLNQTLKIKDFKENGARGILECKIQSIILPLLADHVLREANHYIRLLKKYRNKIDRSEKN